MKILITGGMGFIGAHLAKLFSKMHDVTILDNFDTDYPYPRRLAKIDLDNGKCDPGLGCGFRVSVDWWFLSSFTGDTPTTSRSLAIRMKREICFQAIVYRICKSAQPKLQVDSASPEGKGGDSDKINISKRWLWTTPPCS